MPRGCRIASENARISGIRCCTHRASGNSAPEDYALINSTSWISRFVATEERLMTLILGKALEKKLGRV